jgi:RimJ/RimL family protein N-acetyltransferase
MTRDGTIELRKVTREDITYIYNLRNNEKIRQMFFDTKPLSKKGNESYWDNRIREKKVSYIVLKMKNPIGFVKLDYCDMEKSNYIGVIIHPLYQGKGYAKEVVNQLKEKHKNLKAKIKPNNLASLNLFKSCGFKVRSVEYES